jgi:hypothetical protein
MAKTRIRLTTPYPTVDDVVKTFRIPQREVKKILSLVDDFLEKRARAKASGATKQHPSRKRRPKR